jgi:peptidoglycan hydrolase CwlO-like protein
VTVELEDRVENRFGKLESDVGRVQTDVGKLQADVGKLQADVGQLQSDVRHLQADVTEIKADARQFRAEVTARFEKVLESIAELRTQMVRADLQTRIWMLVSFGGLLGVLARGFKWI